MAKENIEALIQAAEKDPVLADTLRNAGDLDALVQVGVEHGRHFTRAELKAYFEELPPSELGDEELEAVAGGANVRASGGGTSNYLKFELKNAQITSYQIG